MKDFTDPLEGDHFLFASFPEAFSTSSYGDDVTELDPIHVSPDDDGDGGDGDSPDGGSGSTSQSQYIEVIGIEYIETAIITGGASSISGQVTVVIANQYIIDFKEELEDAFAAQQTFVSGLGLVGQSAAEIRELVELIQIAGKPGSPATLWDFAIHENIEIYPGVFDEIELANQITAEHLDALDLIEEGYTVAQAELLSHSVALDEILFADASGNFMGSGLRLGVDVIVGENTALVDGVQIVYSEAEELAAIMQNRYDYVLGNPVDLNENTLDTLRDLVAQDTHEARVEYYEILADHNYGYAGLALGVVKDDTLAGIVARDYASAVGAAVGVNLTDADWDDISQSLMAADLEAREAAVLEASGDATLDYQVIQAYHNQVFADFGLPVDAWTPNVVLNYSEDPDSAWDNLVSAGGLNTMWNYHGFMAEIDAFAAQERLDHWDELYTEVNGTSVPNAATISDVQWMMTNMPAAFQAQLLWSDELLTDTLNEWIVDGALEWVEDLVDTSLDYIAANYDEISEWLLQ